MLVRNASPRGPMCFRCLMFNCQDLVSYYFYFVYRLLDLSCGECDVTSLYFVCCSVNGAVRVVCFVLDSACELFDETIRNVFVCGC